MTSIPRPFRWTTSTGCSHPSAVAAKLPRISPIPAITQACRKLTVEARLQMDQVEIWYGQKKVAQMPRLRGRHKHRVDYRHIIDWLVRKPGALEHYRYRDELFPTSRFRMTFDLLEEQLGKYQG